MNRTLEDEPNCAKGTLLKIWSVSSHAPQLGVRSPETAAQDDGHFFRVRDCLGGDQVDVAVGDILVENSRPYIMNLGPKNKANGYSRDPTVLAGILFQHIKLRMKYVVAVVP